jgi:hypothetical protein
VTDVLTLTERLDERIDQASEVELRERLAEIELALEDRGWLQLSISGQRELSRGGLRDAVSIARLMWVGNPLIKNAVNVQTNYVWGQGVNIVAKADPVNKVVQSWLDFPPNRREFTGHASRLITEVEQQLSGNGFWALFTRPDTGMVRIRSIDIDEIWDVVRNPDDANEPWYYLRVWTPDYDPVVGLKIAGEQREYLPAWNHPLLYEPKRPLKLGEIPIRWDAPTYHLATGGLKGRKFGMPEVYAALDWARAVKRDMEDYATIRRALARFAWQLKRKGGPAAVAAARARLNTSLGTEELESNPPPATGSTFVAGDGTDMQPIRTAGSAPSPDEGRRLWLMVAAGTGIPETMLSGDSTVGNYATAKSLDRPTELEMRNRQAMWAGVWSDILGFVIDQAALAPRGPLAGRLVTDPYTRVQVVQIGPKGKPLDRRVDIDFPSILERDVVARVQAIVGATTLNGQAPAGTLRPETVSRLLLTDLLQDDVDEELAAMDAQGLFDPPEATPKPEDQPPPAAPPAPDPNAPPPGVAP